MSSSRVFYGWWVTVAFSVMVFVSAGVRHAVGPFLKPMVADLGVDRGAFSLVIALGLFLYGAFMPWVGGLTDRFGARLVTAAGSVLLAISLALTCATARTSGSSRWSTACSPRSGSPAPARWWPTRWSRAGSCGGAAPRCPCSAARR